MEIDRDTMGEDHPFFASSLSHLAEIYHALGDYAQAEPLYLQALEINREALGERHPDVIEISNLLSSLYHSTGDSAKAEALNRQSRGDSDPNFAKDLYDSMAKEQWATPEFANDLYALARKYYSQGNYVQAEPPLQQALAIYRTKLGEDHPDFAKCLDILAEIYRARGEYAQAEQLFRQASDILRKALGETHPDVAISLHNLAGLYRSKGDYAQAESLYQQALMIYEKALGEDHPHVAVSLNDLSDMYYERGDYGHTEPLLQKLLKIRRKNLGETHPDVATTLHNLAELYFEKGEYAQTEACLQRALSIKRMTLGDTDPEYAKSLQLLAMLNESRGAYTQAETLYRQASNIVRTALGETHPFFAATLSGIAGLYQKMGNYAQAETLHLQALNIRRKTLGETHSDTATSLSKLGMFYRMIGKYAQAEPYYQQALKITRAVRGETHPNVAASMNNLAILYLAMGDYARALSYSQQASNIARMSLGREHPTFANSLSTLAGILFEIGDYVQAEMLFQQVLDIRRTTLGQVHPLVADSLNSLAVLNSSMGNYMQAEKLFQEALNIRRTILGETHPDVASSMYCLAGLYYTTGDYAQAEISLKQALKIWRTTLGETNPYIASCLYDLALLYSTTNRPTEVLPHLQQAASIDDQMIEQVFSIGSESRRMMYLMTLRKHVDLFLSLILRLLPGSLIALQAGLDLVLRRKAIEAEALAAQRDAILGGRYPALRSKLHELTSLRVQIAQKVLDGPGEEDAWSYQQILDGWKDRKEQLEIELARHIPEMSMAQQLRTTNWREIAKRLPQVTTLVEFVRMSLIDSQALHVRDEDRYLAFVLNSGEPVQVHLIDLGEAEQIDKLIGLFRMAITGESELTDVADIARGAPPRLVPSVNRAEGGTVRHTIVGSPQSVQSAYRNFGIALRNTVFDPLLKALDGRRKLFLAPDGDLTRIPFEALPTDDGNHLIDEYQISYLSTGRDVLRFGTSSTSQPAPPLVVADPDFDLRVDETPLQKEHGMVQERLPLDLDRAGFPFARLTGARKEGERIAKLLNVQPILDKAALESHIKFSRSPRILHIATHGFFLPNKQRNPGTYIFGEEIAAKERNNLGLLPGQEVENPLLRSGLALAGANNWKHKDLLPVEAEDGLLYAEDVSALDLLDTDLVVLSACETGLGQVRTGEGVFGLRRAFILAGAKTLLMSLWKVPDQQTQELMEDFYQRILFHRPRADALREAQIAMKAKHPHPRFWGAFICQGDPGPLSQHEP